MVKLSKQNFGKLKKVQPISEERKRYMQRLRMKSERTGSIRIILYCSLDKYNSLDRLEVCVSITSTSTGLKIIIFLCFFKFLILGLIPTLSEWICVSLLYNVKIQKSRKGVVSWRTRDPLSYVSQRSDSLQNQGVSHNSPLFQIVETTQQISNYKGYIIKNFIFRQHED